jgi:hypothetical protein
MEIRTNDGKWYKLPKPDTRLWKEGPPPEIGWWPCSIAFNLDALRYWDGKRWSKPCHPLTKEQTAISYISECTLYTGLRWTDRWWLNQPEGYPRPVT